MLNFASWWQNNIRRLQRSYSSLCGQGVLNFSGLGSKPTFDPLVLVSSLNDEYRVDLLELTLHVSHMDGSIPVICLYRSCALANTVLYKNLLKHRKKHQCACNFLVVQLQQGIHIQHKIYHNYSHSTPSWESRLCLFSSRVSTLLLNTGYLQLHITECLECGDRLVYKIRNYFTKGTCHHRVTKCLPFKGQLAARCPNCPQVKQGPKNFSSVWLLRHKGHQWWRWCGWCACSWAWHREIKLWILEHILVRVRPPSYPLLPPLQSHLLTSWKSLNLCSASFSERWRCFSLSSLSAFWQWQ